MNFVRLLALLYHVVTPSIHPVMDFVNSNHKFTAVVYKEIMKNQKDNFFFSPFSTEIILALVNEGARHDTSTELANGLFLSGSKVAIKTAISSFLSHLKVSDEVQLLNANIIYVGKDVKIKDDFRSIATNIYDADIDNIDFANNVEAATTINEWVEHHTNNKIKNVINADDLDEDTQMALINALYFSGEWVSHFDSTTKEKFFKTNNNFFEVDTMHNLKMFNYYENPTINAKFLELPYKGARVSMVIVLPNEKEGLPSLEQNVEQLLAPQRFTLQAVDVSLPKFTMESSIHFIPILKKLGIKKLFKDADLTGISSNDNLFVKQIIQKVFINVTEKGTEAAAATTVTFSQRSQIDPIESVTFQADHPFLYFIKVNEVVLFIGRCSDPRNN